MNPRNAYILLILSSLLAQPCLAQPQEEAYELVDMMNAFLVLISCIFVFGIVGTLRNSKLLALVRSAHFFKIRSVISAWTLIGSAILMYTLTELLFAFNILNDLAVYKFFKTVFGVLFAAGLFLQYTLLMKYVKQATEQQEKK